MLRLGGERIYGQDLQHEILRYCWEDLDQRPANWMDLPYPYYNLDWTEILPFVGFEMGAEVGQNMSVGTRVLLEGF
jgi:hypothetical protein